MMRNAIGAFGLIAGAVVATLAARYGYATSDNPVDGGIVAFFFAVIAIGGIAGPAVAVRVFQGARGFGKLWGILWGVLALAAVLANLSNSLGAIAGRSDKTLAIRAQAADARRNDQAELEQLMGERVGLPAFTATDAAGVNAAERAANAARDARAAECTDRGKHCREREAEELTRNAELAAATTAKSATDRAAKLDEEITAARARLEKVPTVSAVNPQAVALEHIFKMPADLAATWQQVAMVVVVELLIAFSLIAWEITAPAVELVSGKVEPSSAPLEIKGNVVAIKQRAAQVPAKFGDVGAFIGRRTTKAKGASVSWVALFVDYREWCNVEQSAPVDASTFGVELDALRVKRRLRTRTEGKDVFFEGVKLAS